MIQLNLKMDKDLLNLLQLRGHKKWPLLWGYRIYIDLKKSFRRRTVIILSHQHLYYYDIEVGDSFIESIIVDDDMNCFKYNESKTPYLFISKLRDGSLKDELKSHILKYGLDYSFDDIVKDYEEMDF